MPSYHVEIKSGRKGTATEHARYIAREGKHSRRGDLLDTGFGNLPQWANNHPEVFWAAADKYERVNGAAYRELVIALPNEFSPEQCITCAERVVAKLIGNKPYQYAIHAPEASLGEASNTHLHAMYSDREPDGIDRPAEQTFGRYNPQKPERGGCRKDSGGRSPLELRDEVIARRKAVADIQNDMFAECGSSSRVDHRSHRERGISSRPERHLGPARIRRMSADEKAEFLATR